MEKMALVDRRFKALSDIDITMTADDKAHWTAESKKAYMVQLEEMNAQLPENEPKIEADLSQLPPPPDKY